jgi:hypothetical protein
MKGVLVMFSVSKFPIVMLIIILVLMLFAIPAYAEDGSKVPIWDWLGFIVGGIGSLIGLLSRSNRLPAAARRWLSKIGQDKILDILFEAKAFTDMTPDEKRKYAIGELQALALKQWGMQLPTSIAGLLVDYMYNISRKLTKR